MSSDIKVGIVLPGHTIKADGIFGSFRGTVLCQNGSTVPAYIKCNSIKRITVELFASKLLEYIGLNTPTPYLVFCPTNVIPEESINVLQRDNAQGLYINNQWGFYGFATEELPLPSFKQRIPNSTQLLQPFMELFIENCSSYVEVIGFDEWIANGDRNIGNILWDGQKNFYLIDHGLSMDENYFNQRGNILLTLVVITTNPSTQKISSMFRRALITVDNLDEKMIDTVAAKLKSLQVTEISENVTLLSSLLKRRLYDAKASLMLKKASILTKDLFNSSMN